MPDLLDDLRRYGAALEAAATRAGSSPEEEPGPRPTTSLTDYPVSVVVTPTAETGDDGPGRHRDRSPRRRRMLVAAAVVVVLVVVAVAVTRRSEDSRGVVDTPPTDEVVPTAEPFEDGTVLLWLLYDEPPQYLGQRADRPTPLNIGDPPQPGRSPIATVNTTAAFFVGGTLHLVDRLGVVTPTDVAGERVIADRAPPAFYVYGSGRLTRYDLSGDRPDPRSLPSWPVPIGWGLANYGVGVDALDGRVILERTGVNAADVEFAVWTLATGELRVLGTARSVIDVAHTSAGPVVAWIDSSCPPERLGCDLVLTDLDTFESRRVVAPDHGFISGGGFSDDGSHLALFVSDHEPLNIDPSANLAVVDVDALVVRVLPDSNVQLGEPIGVAAWTLDGSSVIYHGLSETYVVDIATGTRRTLPWEITYGMATIP